MKQQTKVFESDCVIIGAGVSGTYAAWRLLTDKNSPYKGQGDKVALFEMSDRVGGRLLTWMPFGKGSGLRAELGGMRFLKTSDDGTHRGHELVHKLIGKLGLETTDFYTIEKGADKDPGKDHGILYVRGERTRYLQPDPHTIKARYDLNDTESKAPGSILSDVITTIVQQNKDNLPEETSLDWTKWNRETWDRVKPLLKYQGNDLHKWGFWNLLSTILSNEGYQYLTDALGYYSLVRNWNASEALSFIAQDFAAPPDFFTLKNGLSELPETLAGQFLIESGDYSNLFLGHQLVKFEVDESATFPFTLHFHKSIDDWEKRFPGGDKMPYHPTVRAKKIILALPSWSLKALEPSRAFDPQKNKRLQKVINSVEGMPAFKLFLLYRERWWEKPNGGGIGGKIEHGHSVCDLPIRQTYYFKPDESAKDNGWGLLMVSYDDGQAVDYWRGMEEPPDKRQESREALMNEIQELGLPAMFSGLLTSKDNMKFVPPPNLHLAPDIMTRRAVEQMELLHNQWPGSTPKPAIAAYADWSLDPFGGGWNFWRPQVDALEVMEKLASPLFDQQGKEYDAYIVGEAYCGIQGWVEGTLTQTEIVLQTNFSLKRPDWLPEKYYLGPRPRVPVPV